MAAKRATIEQVIMKLRDSEIGPAHRADVRLLTIFAHERGGVDWGRLLSDPW